MLGSNPSAASVASTDPGDATASPFRCLLARTPLIGRGINALNPGGAGAKPPQAALPIAFCPSKGALS